MRKNKRIIAFVLFLCLFVSLLPPMQVTHAAEVVQRYELDTDGIDPGATYLIVNTGSAGNANALNFNYGNSSNSRGFRNQTMQVQTDENGIRYVATGFTDEADCQFQFSGRESGKITHGDYAVDLTTSRLQNPARASATRAGARTESTLSSLWADRSGVPRSAAKTEHGNLQEQSRSAMFLQESESSRFLLTRRKSCI